MAAEIRDVQSSEMITIPPEGSSFGRMGMKKADVQVPHNSVSGMHARVFQKSGAWYIEDLGSSNGTFVGSDRVESPTRLTKGMRFSLSRYKYEVVSLGEEGDGDGGGGADADTGAWRGYPEGGPDTDKRKHDDGKTSSEARFIDESFEMSDGAIDEPESSSGGMLMTIFILLVVIGLGGVVVWLAMPESEAVDEADDSDVVAAGDIEVPEESSKAKDLIDQGAAVESDATEESTEAAAPEEAVAAEEGAAEGGATEFEEYQRKLGEVEAALKKKPKLLKKKSIKTLYKSLQKKQKKIKKKYKKGKKSKKVNKHLRDSELFKETGPIVDKLHRKLF